MFVVINEADAPMGAIKGKFHMYMLDAAELEKGNVSKLAEGSIQGNAGSTITFRSNWTADGTKIALAAADTVYVIDATSPTLAALGSAASTAGQNHDALPTTDGAYAILTLRTGTAPNVDGQIGLYDMANHQLVGNTVSVCNGCHGASGPSTGNATLCGIDGVVSKSGTTYSGTIYVAGHGGHFAKLAISIDASTPASPVIAAPVAYSTLTKLDVSGAKFPSTAAAGTANTSTHKLHDARLDAATNTLYWSTYNLDASNQLHYGKINLATSDVTDMAIAVPARATMPGLVQDKQPYYCASAQTATAFFPCTMTNEAYITVIPKANIK